MAEVTFGDWLKRRRGALGLTQEQLAQQVGCSTIALRKIEAEERRPSEQIVRRLADVFLVVPDERPSFLRFARGDWQVAPKKMAEETPWRAATTAPYSNLPASTTSLIGREKDIVAVRAYLSELSVRLVTLMGPPGVGKTRLSLESAHACLPDFPDGVFFVTLASLEDPALVALVIAQTLGFVQTERRSPLECLKSAINDRRMLIVLDNFEQIIEAAPLTAELLAACPNLKLIITSRESLRVPGEWLYRVPLLTIPDAAQADLLSPEAAPDFSALTLFAERARAVQPDFALTRENTQTVATICRQLDGLPLAIELVAVRISLMSPRTLLTRLTSDFTLNADGMRGVPVRQKTLHNAIAWSYDLLSRDEQELLARLSVFAGGLTPDAAEVMCQADPLHAVSLIPRPLEVITSLSGKSLLYQTMDAQGERRLNLLVMIREFALNRLRERKQEAVMRERHAAYFLDLAEQANRDIHGPQQVEWLDRLENEHDNCHVALEWFLSSRQTGAAVRMMGALAWTWRIRGYLRELLMGYDKVRTLPDLDDFPGAYVKMLNGVGHAMSNSGAYGDARIVLERSRDLGLMLGPNGERGLAEALDLLGLIASWSEADYETAQSSCEQAVALYRKCEDRWGLAAGLSHLARFAQVQHADGLAQALSEQSLSLFQQLGDVWGMSHVCEILGKLFLQQADYLTARSMFEQFLALSNQLRSKSGLTSSLGLLGEVHRVQGDDDQAQRYYADSLAVSRKYGITQSAARVQWCQGQIALRHDDDRYAAALFQESLIVFVRIGERRGIADCLLGLATLAARSHRPEHAAKLRGAAQSIDEAAHDDMWPLDRAKVDQSFQIVREQLGEERCAVLQAEGRALTIDEATALATAWHPQRAVTPEQQRRARD